MEERCRSVLAPTPEKIPRTRRVGLLPGLPFFGERASWYSIAPPSSACGGGKVVMRLVESI